VTPSARQPVIDPRDTLDMSELYGPAALRLRINPTPQRRHAILDSNFDLFLPQIPIGAQPRLDLCPGLRILPARADLAVGGGSADDQQRA
jgi:hypothetical protein